MFPALTIASMTTLSQPRIVDRQVILASMTVTCGPLTISGVSLVRLDAGEMKLWFPTAGRERRIVVHGAENRAALLTLALTAYRALTGRDPAETPLAKASPTKDSSNGPA